MHKILFSLAGATGLALALLALPAPSTTAGDAGTWALKGSLSDACQCQVFCPCELAEKPTFGHCDDTAILHIDEGHFGPVDLSGQRVVIVSKSPEGERLVDTVGELVFAHMYVPEGASDEQAAALVEIAHRVFGTWVEDGTATRISARETMEKVPMEVSIEPTRHRVTIPRRLTLDIEALTGADGVNPVALRNGPATGPGMGDILVARSHTYRYTDHGIDWDYAGRSASMRTLDLSGRIDDAPAPAEGHAGHHGH